MDEGEKIQQKRANGKLRCAYHVHVLVRLYYFFFLTIAYLHLTAISI